jgi:hypothetical protein
MTTRHPRGQTTDVRISVINAISARCNGNKAQIIARYCFKIGMNPEEVSRDFRWTPKFKHQIQKAYSQI